MHDYYKHKLKKISVLMTAVDEKNTLWIWWEIQSARPFRVKYSDSQSHEWLGTAAIGLLKGQSK